MDISNSPKGKWKTIVEDELVDARKYCGKTNKWGNCYLKSRNRDDYRQKVPVQPFKVGRQVGRYVKFTCKSYWATTCALHSIQVLP